MRLVILVLALLAALGPLAALAAYVLWWHLAGVGRALP